MSFQIPKNEYAGEICNVTLGSDSSEVIVGGDKTLPFYTFEGEMPNRPIVAMEVYDSKPEGWTEDVAAYFSSVWEDPVKWAHKCVADYGADAICLQMASINPDSGNMSADDAAEMVQQVREAVEVPVIIYGDGPLERVAEVMKKVAEVNQNTNLLVGWAEEDSYKTIAAACMGYNHNIISLNPLDVNIAKQLNILLTQLGLSPERIVMDPSTSGLGYGIEYCYSCMERLKIAALLQDDKMTQMPMICNIAPEIWKVKEVKGSQEDYPQWGEKEQRGINWETISVMSMLTAGANIVVMRHPKAVEIIKDCIGKLL